MICTPHQIVSGDQIENNKTGGACSTYGGRGEVHTGFWSENLRERGHLEDAGIDVEIILKWIFTQWDGGVDRIDVAQDRDRLRALVNVVMDLRFP
jgi:hypothetical protein